MAAIDYDLSCSICTENLRGADFSGACPHCDAAIAETVAVASLDADSLTVAEDITCTGCGYNVRTLRLNAHCPECGLDVLESVRPFELRHADFKWLKRVRGGLTNLLLAVGAVVLMIASTLFRDVADLRGLGEAFGIALSIGCSIFFLVMYLTGVLRASTADPHPRTPRGVRIASKVAQWACALPFLWIILAMFASFSGFRFLAGVGGLLAGPMSLILVTIGSLFALSYCLRYVADRGHREGLRSATTVLMWSIGFLGIMTVLSFVVGIAMARTVMPAAMGPGPYAAPAPGSPTATGGTITPAITTALPGGAFGSRRVGAFLKTAGCFIGATFWILIPGCLILGVVLLFLYRGLLSTAIKTAPQVRLATARLP